MQSAEVVLSMLSQKSAQNSEYVFDRLYRNLFNPDFYLLAYSNIYAREGNMTQGVDAETVDGFNAAKVEKTIASLKQETYSPKPVRRKCIPQKECTDRPPGIFSLSDKLVQEVVRLLLQAIYESVFKDTSHGFRPGKSCHTALVQLKTTCKGTNWVIEGDIQGFFDTINHEKLLTILSRKISDGRLLNLIDKFLKAGYMKFQPARYTLTGTPQGGIVSSILTNIYLHNLDVFMEQRCNQLSTQEETPHGLRTHMESNPERFAARKNGAGERAETVLKQMRTMPSQADNIQINYTRYADDFVVMITGNKSLAEQIKEEIRAFLDKELHLVLNPEKTLITNLSDQRVRFLGYDIARTREERQLSENMPGAKKRAANETIQLLVPRDIIQEKLKPFVRNGKAVHHNARINVPLPDLLAQYNAEICGLYNYYCLATDVSTKIGKYRYYHYYSLLKTVARKEKCSIARVLSRYGVNVKLKQRTGTRKIFGVAYQTKEGPKTLTYFNESIKKKDHPLDGNAAQGITETTPPRRGSRSLIDSTPEKL